MKKIEMKTRDILFFILIIALFFQAWCLWAHQDSGIAAQDSRKITDPRFHPDKLQGKPPGNGHRIEPPPPDAGGGHTTRHEYHPDNLQGMPPRDGSRIEPPPPSGPPILKLPEGASPPHRVGSPMNAYSTLPSQKKLTKQDLEVIKTRYILHQWVLSDLVWGILELERSDKYQLTGEQVKKIYPSIKKLAEASAMVEKSNQLVKGLLTEKQQAYIKKCLMDRAYMDNLVAAYPPTGEAEPIFGASFAIYDEAYQILKERAKELEKK